MNEREEWGWVVNGNKAPVTGSSEYLWWRRGLSDEHFAEREGYKPENLTLRDAMDALVRTRGTGWSNEQLVRVLAEIWIPGELKCQTAMIGATPETGQPADPGCSPGSETE